MTLVNYQLFKQQPCRLDDDQVRLEEIEILFQIKFQIFHHHTIPSSKGTWNLEPGP